jgi:hypothetical protein
MDILPREGVENLTAEEGLPEELSMSPNLLRTNIYEGEPRKQTLNEILDQWKGR